MSAPWSAGNAARRLPSSNGWMRRISTYRAAAVAAASRTGSLLRPPRLGLSVVRRERRIELGRTPADLGALHGSLVHHASLAPSDLERGGLVAQPSGLVGERRSERREMPSQEVASTHAQRPTGRIAHHREHDPAEARDDLGRSRLSSPEPWHPRGVERRIRVITKASEPRKGSLLDCSTSFRHWSDGRRRGGPQVVRRYVTARVSCTSLSPQLSPRRRTRD